MIDAELLKRRQLEGIETGSRALDDPLALGARTSWFDSSLPDHSEMMKRYHDWLLTSSSRFESGSRSSCPCRLMVVSY